MNSQQNKKLLALLCLVVLLPLAPSIFGYFPAIGDMRDVFIPLESFFHSQQLQGHIPAWNPAVSFGFPVIAAAQIGFFYPVLFILRFLPIYLELPITLVLHVGALGIGTFLFARKLKMSSHAAFLTAISFTLSQFIWQHSTHLNIFLAIAWFPWQMLAVHTIFQEQHIARKHIAILGLLFGIPILIGQLQIPLLMMAVSLVYAIYVRRGKVMPTVGITIVIGIIALLIASVQLFPTVELASLSSRSSSDGFDIVRANQHSYPLYHLPTLLFPRFYGNDSTYWGKRLEIEYGSYIGVIPFLIAIWYLWNRVALKTERYKLEVFWTILALVTFLLSLGSLSPFRLIGLEPSLWFFSAPARWLLFTTFAASILAGFGFDMIWDHTKFAKKFFKSSALIIFTGVIIGNIFLFVAPVMQNTKLQSMIISAKSSSISFASPYTYIGAISLAAFLYALTHKQGKNIIIAVTALDLIIICATTTPVLPWKQILTTPNVISHLPQNVLSHNARIYSLRENGDTGAYFTNPQSRANTKTREIQRNLLLPMSASQFGIYGVEWPASLDLTSQSKARENLPQGAEDLAIGAILSADTTGEIQVQNLVPRSRVELVSPPYQGGAGGGLVANASIISESPNTLTIKTTSNVNTNLIVRDTFYPGWHAYIDGNEVAIHQQEPFFRSVQVQSGEHVVTMKYVPKMIYMAGVATLIILLICAIVALL